MKKKNFFYFAKRLWKLKRQQKQGSRQITERAKVYSLSSFPLLHGQESGKQLADKRERGEEIKNLATS